MTSPPATNRWRRLGNQVFWVAAAMVVCAWALSAQAQPRAQQQAQQAPQQPKRLLRIGVLNEAWAASHPTVEGLKAGLRDLGLEEGRDLRFDIRFTEGKIEAMPEAAIALAKAGVDLI